MKAWILAAAFAGFSSLAATQELKTATLHADKISCEACTAVITKALRGVPGVGKVEVDVARKEVRVQFDPAKAKPKDLAAATARKGFPASLRRLDP